LSDGAMQKVLHTYNENFKESPKLQATPEIERKRFRDIANISENQGSNTLKHSLPTLG